LKGEAGNGFDVVNGGIVAAEKTTRPKNDV
jgi:hypothetical protein